MRTESCLYDDDVRLMLDFRAGNASSFETLLKKYFPPLVNFIYRYTGNKYVAEELAQEAFLRVYRHAASYSPRSKFKTWLYTIARNLAVNELRRNRRNTVSLDMAVDTGDGKVPIQMEDKKAALPDSDVMKAETARIVKKAIYALPEKQRAAVILRRYEDLSYKDIADTMGISSKAVKSLLNRARENLRRALSRKLGIKK
jgi:RNA polymerase sigma-70 factor (ECF subfamily)